MNTQTLDEKLRERAREKLAKHLRVISNDLDVMSGSIQTRFRLAEEPNREMTASQVLHCLLQDVAKWHEPHWEQREVDRFLAEVQEIKTQLESLDHKEE